MSDRSANSIWYEYVESDCSTESSGPKKPEAVWPNDLRCLVKHEFCRPIRFSEQIEPDREEGPF